MPSPRKSKPKRICVVGDSHLGALKRAVDAGAVANEGYEVEFYGAPGPYFRGLRLVKGQIRPDKFALDVVRMVTQNGRTVLDPGDFDAILFYGARLASAHFMREFLHRKHAPEDYASHAVRAAVLSHLIQSARFARIAFAFAADEKTQVFYASAPFPTQGVNVPLLAETPMAAQATVQDRDALWQEIEAIFAKENVVFLRQPEETVVDGALTQSAYGVEEAQAKDDAWHKNSAYGETVLQQFAKAYGV